MGWDTLMRIYCLNIDFEYEWLEMIYILLCIFNQLNNTNEVVKVTKAVAVTTGGVRTRARARRENSSIVV